MAHRRGQRKNKKMTEEQKDFFRLKNDKIIWWVKRTEEEKIIKIRDIDKGENEIDLYKC